MWMESRFRVIALALMLMVSACGGGGGGVGTPGPASVSYWPRFGFDVNRGDNTLSVYLINAASGQWLHNGYALTGTAPVAVAVSANEQFVYTANNSGTVSAYKFDNTTGRLALVEHQTAGTAPSALAVTSNNALLYVLNSGDNQIAVFTIDSMTGALSPATVPTHPVGTTPSALVIHPTRSLLYVANGADGTISGFSVDTSTGALAILAGSPYPVDTIPVGTNPQDLAIDPSGRFLYVANEGSDNITAFFIDAATGVLTTPTTVAAGDGPRSITVAGGGYAYAANYLAGTISIYKLDSMNGVPTPVSSQTTVASPRSLRADISGNFLFVTSEVDQVVQGYRVNTTSGALTALDITRTRIQPMALALSTGTGALSPQAKHAYLVNSSGARVFSVNTSNGALSFRSTANTGSVPISIAVDPFNRFAYVVNNADSSLSGYSVNDTTGALSRIDLDPNPFSNDLSTVGTDPQQVVMEPSGRFLYVSLTTAGATGQVRGYIVALDGKLSEISGSPYTVGANPKQLTVDPTGQYLYVVNQNSAVANGNVSAFSINSTTGALTSLGGVVATGPSPESVAIEPSGRFAYVGNRGATNSGTTLSRYSIALAGTLSPLTPATTTETGPVDLAMDPLGRFIYVASVNPPRLAGYGIASNNGSLSGIGPPLSTSASPVCMEVDPSGRFAYVGFTADTNVSVYSIGGTGSLSPLSTVDAVDPAMSFAMSRRLVSTGSSPGFWR